MQLVTNKKLEALIKHSLDRHVFIIFVFFNNLLVYFDIYVHIYSIFERNRGRKTESGLNCQRRLTG